MQITRKAAIPMLAVAVLMLSRGTEAKAQDGARIAAGVLQGIANGLDHRAGHGPVEGPGPHLHSPGHGDRGRAGVEVNVNHFRPGLRNQREQTPEGEKHRHETGSEPNRGHGSTVLQVT